MEAMAAGLPVICSEIRGNTDLIEEPNGGLLIKAKSAKMYALAIKKVLTDENTRRVMGVYNKSKIERYSIDSIKKKMYGIYSRIDYKIMQTKNE